MKTVKELVEALKLCDQNARVVLESYSPILDETVYLEIEKVKVGKVVKICLGQEAL